MKFKTALQSESAVPGSERIIWQSSVYWAGRRIGWLTSRIDCASLRGYIARMCGRATYKLTWEEIVALYRLTLGQPAVNTRARYNACPTTTIDPILEQDGK